MKLTFRQAGEVPQQEAPEDSWVILCRVLLCLVSIMFSAAGGAAMTEAAAGFAFVVIGAAGSLAAVFMPKGG